MCPALTAPVAPIFLFPSPFPSPSPFPPTYSRYIPLSSQPQRPRDSSSSSSRFLNFSQGLTYPGFTIPHPSPLSIVNSFTFSSKLQLSSLGHKSRHLRLIGQTTFLHLSTISGSDIVARIISSVMASLVSLVSGTPQFLQKVLHMTFLRQAYEVKFSLEPAEKDICEGEVG